MFKKPSDVDVSRSSALGGKDVKKFKSRCLALLPNLDDAGFDELFPGKSVMKTKLKIGAVIYVNVDATPMILDPSNDHMDVAIPSVYALALLPELVPNIEVNASAVSSTMMRGSDLFLQGVNRDALVAGPPLLAGQLRSVRVPGNPIPFAVGTMTVSSREAEEAGWSGRGLITKHVYGDELWKTGDRMVPNCGFEASSVGPCGIDEGAIANELADKASLGASREADGEASVSPGYDEIVMNICLGALLSCRSWRSIVSMARCGRIIRSSWTRERTRTGALMTGRRSEFCINRRRSSCRCWAWITRQISSARPRSRRSSMHIGQAPVTISCWTTCSARKSARAWIPRPSPLTKFASACSAN